MTKRVKAEDRIGTTLNGFKIIDIRRIGRRAEALAICPFCKKEKWIRIDSIMNKKVVSCGCYNKENNYAKSDDIQGKRFGRLVVVEKTEKYKKGEGYIWKCQCDCGNETYVPVALLKSGKTKSCGCIKDESVKISLKKMHKENLKCVADGSSVLLARPGKKPPKSNTSGHIGVSWDSSRSKWASQIRYKGKNYHLGRYDDIKLAVSAREEAEKELFGNFQKWYEEKFPETYKKLKEKGSLD